MTPVQENALQALGNGIRIVGVVESAPIKILTANIPIDLRVVDTNAENFLLGMDWFNKYQVTLNITKKELEFISEGRKYKTMVE